MTSDTIAATASGESNAGKVRVIACGMIAREIIAVCEQHGLGHVSLTCLPAMFHHYPDRIVPAARAAIAEARGQGYGSIFIGYADCGTGGLLDRLCAEEGVERIAGPHCFAFYQGNARFEEIADDDMTSFYMTDFLARHFDAFLVKPLGLDRHPELKDMYFGNYTRMVYLAQTEDKALEQMARAAATYLGLGYEYRLTGYGDLLEALKALRPASHLKGVAPA